MDSTTVAYIVDDGFRVTESLKLSMSGLMLLMSPSNIIIWDTRNSDISSGSGSHVFEHVGTFSVIPYISQEFKEKLSRMETFIGTSDKVAFEGACWSPLQPAGGSLLAVSVHSGMSVHFKVMECVWRFGCLEFRELVSLMEILRDQWFLIPLYTSTGEHFPITNEWPSLSLCLEGLVQPSFVAWSLSNVLVIGWGNVLFLWNNKFECVSALQVPNCDFSNVPLKSVRIIDENETGFTIACESVRGVTCQWRIDSQGSCTFSSDSPYAQCPTMEYTVERKPGKPVLHIVQTPKIHSLDVALELFLHSPSLELARLVALLYKPREKRLVELNGIRSIIARFSPSFALVPDTNELAFGLHTLHCRIDPIAMSNPKARFAERRHLLAQMGCPVEAPVACIECTETHCTVDDAFRTVVCTQGHIHPLLVETMQAADDNSVKDIVQCCFCKLLTMCTVQDVYFNSQTETIKLHGRVWVPVSIRDPKCICILVHPWSVLGGSSANTEPYAQILANCYGIECLTFDLRGVGHSTGSSTYRGTGEVQDVLGACSFVQKRSPGIPIVLVGSSAGASIAGSAFDQVPEAVAYVGIGYTFGWMSRLIFGHHFDAILKSTKPKLFIMGTNDQFTSVPQLQSRVETMRNIQMELIPNVGHFELETPKYAKVTSEIIARFIVHAITKMS